MPLETDIMIWSLAMYIWFNFSLKMCIWSNLLFICIILLFIYSSLFWYLKLRFGYPLHSCSTKLRVINKYHQTYSAQAFTAEESLEKIMCPWITSLSLKSCVLMDSFKFFLYFGFLIYETFRRTFTLAIVTITWDSFYKSISMGSGL